jgi:2-oxoisovalerate dehydrogenase E1 component alpha subunit
MPRGKTIVLPYYRSWAAVLAYGMTPLDLFLAVFAKRDDPSSGGKQMPGHFCRRDLDIITTSSVVATQIPHAAGAAYAAKLRKTGQVAIAYFGEGGTSEGDFHEGLNFAAIHTLPVIFFCENNEYAISVPVAKQMAVANVADRAPAYGIAGCVVDGNDVVAVYRATQAAVDRALRGEGPTLIEAKTYRTGPHTSDDDDRGYRDAEETRRWRTERDPILRHERGLRAAGLLTDVEDTAIKARVAETVEAAIETARNRPDPELSDLAAHVYGDRTRSKTGLEPPQEAESDY